MKTSTLARGSWLLLSAWLAGLGAPLSAHALTLSASSHEDVERLTVTFDRKRPQVRVFRSGRQVVRLAAEPGDWQREEMPATTAFSGGLLVGFSPGKDGMELQLSTDAFGYIAESGPAENQLSLTFFPDVTGARWSPLPPDVAPMAVAAGPGSEEPEPKNSATAPVVMALSAPVAASNREEDAPEVATTPVADTPEPESEPQEAISAEPAQPAEPVVPAAASFKPPVLAEGNVVRGAIDLTPINVKDAVSEAPGMQASPAEVGQVSQVAEAPQPMPEAMATETPAVETPVVEAAAEPSPGEAPASTIVAEAQAEEPTPEAVSEVMPEPASAVPQAASPAPQSDAPNTMTAAIQWGGPEDATAFATSPTGVHEAGTAETALADAGGAVQDSIEWTPAGGEVVSEASGASEAEPALAETPAEQTPETAPAFEVTEAAEVSSEISEAESAAPAEVAEAEAAEPSGEVVAEGPPEISLSEKYNDAMRSFVNGEYEDAISKFDKLLLEPEVEGDMHEEVLHHIAQAHYNLHKEDLTAHFDDVVGPLERAVNYNPKSPRVPQALLQLGLAHLKVDNLPEANAYFGILQSKFPRDLNIPYIDHYYGDYWTRKGEWQKAADAYQHVVQDYPDAPIIRESSVGLANALNNLEYYDQAYLIVDFISKRWPRYYIEAPEFLRLSGELASRLDRFGEAKDALWNYYNMQPDAPGNDIVLARIGDIHLRENRGAAARDIYTTVADRYPKEEGGLVSKMRLAEEGIYDTPTLDEMYKVFDRPYNLRPEQIYTEIIKEHPDSPLAPVAQLKLAMWQLFSNRYWDSIDSATQLCERYPDSQFKERGLKVAAQAFAQGARLMAEEENYLRVVDIWDRKDILRQAEAHLDPETRLLLATSLWHTERPTEALEAAQPLLTAEGMDESGLAALSLAMNIHLQHEDWESLLALGELSEGWPMPADQGRQMDFALALAEENLERPDDAKVRWTRLAADSKLPPDQRGYALYYLARASNGDLQQQYLYAQEALALFLQDGRDTSKIKDSLLMLTEVARTAGRLKKALHWARQYDRYVNEGDKEWAASRFRLAELHQQLGDSATWQAMMEELKEKSPASLFGRMASSNLNSLNLEERLAGYSPTM